MGKGAACIICSSIIIISLFCLMSYLMTKVNPAPIVSEQLPSKNVGRTILYDNIMFDIPTRDNGQYKLWKPEQGSMADLATFSTAQILFDQEYHTLWTFPTPRRISTQSPGLVMNRTIPLPILKVLNKTEEVDRETTTAGLNGTLILIPVKRSVKEFKKIKGEINSVILKIIDDSGQFNIEIKIGSNDSYWQGNDKNRAKKKPTLSMYFKTKNDDIYEESDLTKSDDNVLNAESIGLSIHDEYGRTFSNKTEYVNYFNHINNAIQNKNLDKQYKNTSTNNSFNYNITRDIISNDVKITKLNVTSKYNYIYIDGSNATYYTIDYNNSTGEYKVVHDDNSIKTNKTTFKPGTTNNITDHYNGSVPESNAIFAFNVTNNNVDSKYVKDVNNFLSNNATYNDTTNRNMQFEYTTKDSIIDYINNTLKKTTFYNNNNPYTFFFENATESLKSTHSNTFEIINNALSKVLKKMSNATKRYKGNIYGFTITDATKVNMDIDNLIPMENVNSNAVTNNNDTITVVERPVTKKSSIKPFELLAHAKSTIPFKLSIKSNNSLLIKKATKKDDDTILKINKSGKYKNLPIVFPKSKEFALDSGSDQGSAIKDTR